ncbi:hypothetical protein [Rufibacter roseus]|uniref:Uncharacterized protein n=1 Tax=Rufibacter roseus TaxID=1567108 RepID=A0ABW2DN07_9BACT|nr:hypothetical protein [Rufibacter roseus]
MNVHIIRSAYFLEEDYQQVLQLLNSKPGPLTFHGALKEAHKTMWEQENAILATSSKDFLSPESQFKLDEITTFLEWEDFFKLCDVYRKENKLGKEDFVVLLTPHYNTNNWFASYADETNNIFAHTADWEYYLANTPAIYPITYLVTSQVIQKTVYQTIDEKLKHVHYEALGCMNDFCETKSQISLKLRTADICPVCLDDFTLNKKNDKLLNQAFSLFEEIRGKLLYKQHHKPRPSRLYITKENEIVLRDYRNSIIRLTPLEKTVFLFYLMYPDGIKNEDLPNYRTEIEEIYKQLNNNIPTVNNAEIAAIKLKLKGTDSKTVEAAIEERYNEVEVKIKNKIESSVTALIKRTSNSMSEKRSNIKASFINVIGQDAASYYIILGADKEPYKINLDRSLVTCDSDIYGTTVFPAKLKK